MLGVEVEPRQGVMIHRPTARESAMLLRERTCSRRPGVGIGRRHGFRGVGGGGGAAAPEPSLEEQIIAEFTAVSWTVPALFLARAEDVTLSSGRVTTWANLGTGSDATQGTDGARPTWNATGLNSLPTLTFDGGDTLATGTYDLTGPAQAVIVLFRDTAAGAMTVLDYGNVSFVVRTNLVASGLRAQGNVSGNNIVDSAGSFPMTDPAVVTATFDTALSGAGVHETEIRHGGANVSNAWAATTDNAETTMTGKSLLIGALTGPVSFLTGAISALVHVSGTGPISGAVLTAIANAEALIAEAWGL